MHVVFFGIKRVHIEMVRFTGQMIWESTLTAARFDLMRIVNLYPDGIAQSALSWLLGVTAPVVSRMLKALEERGFVERVRDAKDRRRRIVRLTTRGGVAVRIALSVAIHGLEADRTAARAVLGCTSRETADEEPRDTIADAREDVAELDVYLSNARRALADRAPFHHPWRPVSLQLPLSYTTPVMSRIQAQVA